MREWILGLRKGATSTGEGLSPAVWPGVEAEAGLPVPGELRDLYQEMNGAELPPDVKLYPLRADAEPGVLERSRAGIPGLAERGWVFGAKGETVLFAARKQDLLRAGAPKLPDWLAHRGEDEWCYGRRTGPEEVRYYGDLEQLLTRLVPPTQTEEFGDNTYARALSAVAVALGELEEEEPAPSPKRAAPSKKPAPQKKSAPKKPAKSAQRRPAKRRR